jgi:hypothetical protein
MNNALLKIRCVLILTLLVATLSCKKELNSLQLERELSSPGKIGLYQTTIRDHNRLLIAVSKVGTANVNYKLIFDTGSAGMVLDARGILPASMIANTGFVFDGDSIQIGGITITKYTATIKYGTSASSKVEVYGNLAYACVTIGDYDGNIVVKRLPFLLYYKSVNGEGVEYEPHAFDVMGVSPEKTLKFANNSSITSPFSYYDPGNGLLRGFKIAKLGVPRFSKYGYFSPNAISIGISAEDIEGSGFTITQLLYSEKYGYDPYLPSKVIYNNKLVYTNVLFDSGTVPYSYIEDNTAAQDLTLLPPDSQISIILASGYQYSYTTSTNNNLTMVQNFTSSSSAPVSIIGLDFFFNNEYLIDYTHHRLGFKK